MNLLSRIGNIPPPAVPVPERQHLPHDVAHGDDREVIPLPRELERALTCELLASLTREYDPIGPTEQALVRDMARATAAMERWAAIAEAVARQSARRLPELSFLGEDLDVQDVQFAAIANEKSERCERHSLGHSRAFQRAYLLLLEHQRQRRARERSASTVPPAIFRDEAACEQYLIDRLKRGCQACRKCESRDGYYYEDRRIWECARCHTQTGLRTGTVMARSQLSLWHWFSAIGWMLFRPTVSAHELAQTVGLQRPATVRSVMHKIHTAMAADDASEQLAGLDLRFATGRPHLCQASIQAEILGERSTGLRAMDST